MSNTETKSNNGNTKTSVRSRWSDTEVQQIQTSLTAVVEQHRDRPPTWQVEHAMQQVLPEDRWHAVRWVGDIPLVLQRTLAPHHPGLLRDTKMNEGKCEVVRLLVEMRLQDPFRDFCHIYNEVRTMCPEVGLLKITHPDFIDEEVLAILKRRFGEILNPPPLPPPPKPDLTQFPAAELLQAYHTALMRELQGGAVTSQAGGMTQDEIEHEIEREVEDALTQQMQQLEAKFAARLHSEIQAIVDMIPETPNNAGLKKAAASAPKPLPPPESGQRTRIKIVIVDQLVCRKNPQEFERTWNKKAPARYKLKWTFCPLDGKSKGKPNMPTERGFVILMDSTPAEWKDEAYTNLGKHRVFITQNSFLAVEAAMQTIVDKLNRDEIN